MTWWDPIRWLTRSPREERAKPGRKTLAAGAPGVSSRYVWAWPTGALVITIVWHLLSLPVTQRVSSDLPVVGEVAEEEVRAPFDFTAPLLDRDIEMRQLQQVLVEPPVMERSVGQQEVLREKLANISDEWREIGGMTRNERLGVLALRHPDQGTGDLQRLVDLPDSTDFFRQVEAVAVDLLLSGVADELPPGNYRKVRVLDGGSETTVDLETLVHQEQVQETVAARLVAAGFDPDTAAWGARLVRPMVSPNMIFSPETTRARRLAARQSVAVEREYLRGERIVDRGKRVSEQDALALGTLHAMLVSRGSVEGAGDVFGRSAARVIMVAMLIVLFGWVAHLFVPALVSDPRKLTCLTVIFSLYIFGAAFALNRPDLGVFAVPITWLGVLITALFRDRVGYPAVILAAALGAFSMVIEPLHVVAWLVLGLASVTLVRRIRQRDQFYQAIAVLAGLGVLLVGLLDLISGEMDAQIWHRLLVACLTPMASVALALFLLPMVEPLVSVSSDLTLLELSDLNHPLLKRMALQCQGTFHHSQVVGQLAEHAARTIGANSLLTRVGALFHDIGKMAKPEYFVENQGGGRNKHDELSPSMSALVVAAHVKEGIELGRKWRLPQAVIDFIPEHHGTNVMKFFYHKALESGGNETVKVDDFRYPGPKPQSRETAIMMLADAVEAATRSLAKPTPGRIREMVKQIFDERMLSGELDQCGLTLRDLSEIRESFIPLLTSIHHSRIAYPGQREHAATKDVLA